MKTFKTTPEDRLKQLENLLEDMNSTMQMVRDEMDSLKLYLSHGMAHPNQLFESLTAINDDATNKMKW